MSDSSTSDAGEGGEAPRQTDVEEKKAKRPPPAETWWNAVTDESSGDRGVLARLRRCSFPAEAWGEAETTRLYRMLGYKPEDLARRAESVAILAIVLAGVRTDAPGRLGAVLGSGDPPVLHPLRLRRLTAARDGAETLRGFREVVALLKGAAPVGDLAKNILGWLDLNTREATRTRFLFDYHGADFAAPDNDISQTADDTEQTS